jgi:hypothetical protein
VGVRIGKVGFLLSLFLQLPISLAENLPLQNLLKLVPKKEQSFQEIFESKGLDPQRLSLEVSTDTAPDWVYTLRYDQQFVGTLSLEMVLQESNKTGLVVGRVDVLDSFAKRGLGLFLHVAAAQDLYSRRGEALIKSTLNSENSEKLWSTLRKAGWTQKNDEGSEKFNLEFLATLSCEKRLQ